MRGETTGEQALSLSDLISKLLNKQAESEQTAAARVQGWVFS